MNFAAATGHQPNDRTEHIDGSVVELAGRFGPTAPTLLAVWAHPDDESYLGAGLMAAVAERGGRVVNATATWGELGTDDPERFPPDRLAEIRRGELDTATTALGVAETLSLGFGDGECDTVPDAIGTKNVARVIDDVRPDVVLSFGPDGVTGHADHRAIARWTAAAVAAAGNRIPLVTTAAAEAWPTDLVERMHCVNAFYPGYPDLPTGGVRWAARLTGGLLHQKMAALEAHASQIGPLVDELAADYSRLAAHEAYRPGNSTAQRCFRGTPAAERAA